MAAFVTLQVVSTDTGIVDTSNNRVWLYDGAPGMALCRWACRRTAHGKFDATTHNTHTSSPLALALPSPSLRLLHRVQSSDACTADVGPP